MAVTFTSGTISQASSALAGAALQSAFRDALVAITGYTLVEEYNPGTNNWVVIKLASATSGLSTDLYIIVGRVVSTGDIRVMMCEAYNSGTHLMSKVALLNTSAAQTVAADQTSTLTFTLGTAAMPSGAGAPAAKGALPPASCKWSLCADQLGAIFSWQVGAGSTCVHAACVTSLVVSPATNDPVPAILTDCTVSGTSSSGGGSTRHPLVTPGSVTWAFGTGGCFSTPVFDNYADFANGTNDAGYSHPDLFSGGVPYASRLRILQAAGSSIAQTVGRSRGTVRNLRAITDLPVTVFGDTFIIDSVTWSVVYVSGGIALLVPTA